MKRSFVLVIFAACGGTPPPAAPTANTCATEGPSCKIAVEKANTISKSRDRDVTMAIGECEQQSWSLQARQCVNDAKAQPDLVACGQNFKLGERGMFAEHMSADRAMKVMLKYKDQFCACKDSACAQRVSDDMTKWGQEEARNNAEPPKMTEEETKAFTQIGEEMGKCMQKAMGGTP
jgi:hypothetical protein